MYRPSPLSGAGAISCEHDAHTSVSAAATIDARKLLKCPGREGGEGKLVNDMFTV